MVHITCYWEVDFQCTSSSWDDASFFELAITSELEMMFSWHHCMFLGSQCDAGSCISGFNPILVPYQVFSLCLWVNCYACLLYQCSLLEIPLCPLFLGLNKSSSKGCIWVFNLWSPWALLRGVLPFTAKQVDTSNEPSAWIITMKLLSPPPELNQQKYHWWH